MRWDRLFNDLEGQLERELDAEEIDLAAEEQQHRLGRLPLRDRLAARVADRDSDPLVIETTAGAVLPLHPDAVGRDWISGSLAGARSSRAVVPLMAVAVVRLPRPDDAGSAPAEPSASSLEARLGLAFVLRDLGRRRSVVAIETGSGVLHGTIERVAQDHLDLAERDPGESRRSPPAATRLVPFFRIDNLRY